MTTEPKFIPESAVRWRAGESAASAHRLRGLHGGGLWATRRMDVSGWSKVWFDEEILRPRRRDWHPQGHPGPLHHRIVVTTTAPSARYPAKTTSAEKPDTDDGSAGQANRHPAQQHPTRCPDRAMAAEMGRELCRTVLPVSCLTSTRRSWAILPKSALRVPG